MRFAVHGRKGYGEDLVADIIADVKDPAAPIFQARRHDERPHHERGPLARFRQVADGGAASIDHYPLSGEYRVFRGGNLPKLTHWLFVCGHFHDLIQQGVTMSDITIPGGRIRSFVERIENIDTELQELSEQKKEVFSEAKGEGFDVKILKEIIKLRKEDKEE